MVDATGQKNSMRDSSVLTRDEHKSSADIHITNTIPTSIIIKNTKESNRSNTWRTGRLSRNRGDQRFTRYVRLLSNLTFRCTSLVLKNALLCANISIGKDKKPGATT